MPAVAVVPAAGKGERFGGAKLLARIDGDVLLDRTLRSLGRPRADPARVRGWVCKCGTKLNFKDKRATCEACGAEYQSEGDHIKPLSPQGV